MAGIGATPVPGSGMALNGRVCRNDGGALSKSGLSASDYNSVRILLAIDRLHRYLNTNSSNAAELLDICVTLAKSIDYATVHHEVPSRCQELPPLVKQVCQCRKNDVNVQAAIMVLMISIKNACQFGWFPDRDSEEISNLAMEIASCFCGVSSFNIEPNCSNSMISIIMSRFYPRLKVGRLYAFLEAKPGFDAYMSDIHITKESKPPSGEYIRLFVVQSDNIETSSCLISPSKVNFLLNGNVMETRTTLITDTGPRIPTILRNLKYGSNLLQAVGEFNGNYIIAVASMSNQPNPGANTLQDYEEHATVAVDSASSVLKLLSKVIRASIFSASILKTMWT